MHCASKLSASNTQGLPASMSQVQLEPGASGEWSKMSKTFFLGNFVATFNLHLFAVSQWRESTNLLAQQLLHKNRLHITNHSRTPFWANPVATVPCEPYGHFGQHMPFSVVGKTWSAWYADVAGCWVKPLSIWQWHTMTIDLANDIRWALCGSILQYCSRL